MERTRIIVPSGTVIKVKIKDLRVSSEDAWHDEYIKKNGDSIAKSVMVEVYRGNIKPLKDWCESREMDWRWKVWQLFLVYKLVTEKGQMEPIRIYRNYKINTGHKRSSAMWVMGKKEIEAEVVPDNFKL